MEGYNITPQMREQCKRVLVGKTSTADVLRQFAANRVARVTK